MSLWSVNCGSYWGACLVESSGVLMLPDLLEGLYLQIRWGYDSSGFSFLSGFLYCQASCMNVKPLCDVESPLRLHNTFWFLLIELGAWSERNGEATGSHFPPPWGRLMAVEFSRCIPGVACGMISHICPACPGGHPCLWRTLLANSVCSTGGDTEGFAF